MDLVNKVKHVRKYGVVRKGLGLICQRNIVLAGAARIRLIRFYFEWLNNVYYVKHDAQTYDSNQGVLVKKFGSLQVFLPHSHGIAPMQ